MSLPVLVTREGSETKYVYSTLTLYTIGRVMSRERNKIWIFMKTAMYHITERG